MIFFPTANQGLEISLQVIALLASFFSYAPFRPKRFPELQELAELSPPPFWENAALVQKDISAVASSLRIFDNFQVSQKRMFVFVFSHIEMKTIKISSCIWNLNPATKLTWNHPLRRTSVQWKGQQQ